MYRFGLLMLLPERVCCDRTEQRTCCFTGGLFVSVCVVGDGKRGCFLVVVLYSKSSSSSRYAGFTRVTLTVSSVPPICGVNYC